MSGAAAGNGIVGDFAAAKRVIAAKLAGTSDPVTPGPVAPRESSLSGTQTAVAIVAVVGGFGLVLGGFVLGARRGHPVLGFAVGMAASATLVTVASLSFRASQSAPENLP